MDEQTVVRETESVGALGSPQRTQREEITIPQWPNTGCVSPAVCLCRSLVASWGSLTAPLLPVAA
jgi:hypothetical protein